MKSDLFPASSIIAALPDPTFVIGPDGTVRLANRPAADLLGYAEAGELTGLPVERLAQSASGASLWACMAPLLAGERQESIRLNLLFARKDCSRFPVELSLSVLDEAGERWVLLTARDLSEREQVDAAVREQAERYAAMRAATMDGVVLTDEHGRLLDVNEAYCQMSGFTREELLARSIPDLEALEDTEGVRQHIQRILTRGGDRFETRHRTRAGRAYDVEVSITVWPTRQWLFALVHDIAERKQAEERLRKNMALLDNAHQRLALHVRCMPLAYIVYDNDRRITEWNPAAERIFGWKTEEVLGKHGNLIIHPDSRPTVERIWENLRAGIEEAEGVNENITKDGRRITCAWFNAAIFDAQGQMVGVLSMASDITEKKRVEAALRKSEQEHKVLLRELYHRTKNNMQVIVAMLELQQMYTNDQTVLRILADMRSRIQSMALVHQKLYQSRSLSRIDLGEYLRDLAALLADSYQVRPSVKICLDTEVVPVTIDTAIPCGLVLNELVTNAMKYAFPGERTGEIRVSIRRDEQGQVVLSVADSGVGLPAGLDPRQDGRLGMQTLIALVEHQLQGRIEFESIPNRGVTCQVTFPDGQD